MGTSLTSIKAAVPTAPTPIHRISTLASLDDAYVPLFPDPEDICLSSNEHAVPCSITWSVFVLHQQNIPFKLLPLPKGSCQCSRLLPVHIRQRAQKSQSYTCSWPKHSSRHSHNECGPLQCFPCKSTKSNSWNIQANPQETTKHCLSTHVRLVHHEVQAYHNQRSWGKLTENGCHLASLRRFWATHNAPLHGASYASTAH